MKKNPCQLSEMRGKFQHVLNTLFCYINSLNKSMEALTLTSFSFLLS